MERYVIECRTPDGKLDFTGPQPGQVFGMGAIRGITEDDMAKVIFAHVGESVVLDGRHVAVWPTFVDPRFKARKKTW